MVRARTPLLERFRRIVEFRELLVGMTRKELKVKYKNSILGFAWSLLNPLLYLIVFYIAFVKILGSGIPAFPIFLLSGLLVWNLFSTGLGAACSSVVGNAGLVKKVSFPREILPLAAVGSMLVHFFLQSMVLFSVLAIIRWDVSWQYVTLLPLALLALLLLTGALGILLRATNVYLRDTQHFLELALLAWFWMTPIVYGFMTIGRARQPVLEGVHAQPGDADRADLPARAVRAARQPESRADRGRPEAQSDPAALAADRLPRLPRLLVRGRAHPARDRDLGVRPQRGELRRGALAVPPAIEIKHVSKRFRLYHEHYSSLKERMIHFGRIPFEDFVALDDINITIEEGTTVGILGHNGSGKSTLLKCVAGILQPNDGEIVTHGRMAALLELGAGFHPELTGRENIFMNASILGLSKRDIAAVFDEIVAFSELDKFIDMQVRHYSSGMYIRLGFAVAVNVDPDILLVDEVLSVGDEAFQRKCIERVKRFQREGRTILFVTHAADLVRRICERGIVLDHGEMIADAAPGEAVRTFRESLQRSGLADPTVEAVEAADATETAGDVDESPQTTHGRRMAASATHRVQITNVSIEHPGSLLGHSWLLPDEAMTIRVGYHASEPTDDLLFGIAIHDEEGNNIFGTNTKIEGVPVPVANGDGTVTFDFERIPLLDGTYLVTLAIQSTDEGTVHDWRDQQYQFSVMNPARTAGLVALPAQVRFETHFAENVEGSGS